MAIPDSIGDFWAWFATNAKMIRDAYEHGDNLWLDSEISPRIAQIAEGMNWEIGPYCHPDSALVLSPSSRENLAIAKQAVAIAPAVEGWRFLAAKPPKDLLSLEFEAENVLVNANDWRYRLTSYNQGEFVDIEVFFDHFVAPPSEHEDLFCELVVEALIGEEMRLERVGYLTPQSVNDVSIVDKATSITYLKKHLEQLVSQR